VKISSLEEESVQNSEEDLMRSAGQGLLKPALN